MHIELMQKLVVTDIVATTNDGSAVMEKYGRFWPAEYQLRSHGVTDVFYVKTPNVRIIIVISKDDNTEYDSYFECDFTHDCENNFTLICAEDEDIEVKLSEQLNIKTVVTNTRKIISFFLIFAS